MRTYGQLSRVNEKRIVTNKCSTIQGTVFFRDTWRNEASQINRSVADNDSDNSVLAQPTIFHQSINEYQPTRNTNLATSVRKKGRSAAANREMLRACMNFCSLMIIFG